MKKLMLILMCVIIAVSSCVYAQPVETDVETEAVQEEAAEAPAEDLTTESPNQIQVMLMLDVALDSSYTLTARSFLDQQTYAIYQMMKDQIAEQNKELGVEIEFGEANGMYYMDMITKGEKGDPIVFGASPTSNANYRFAAKKGFFGTTYFATTAYDSRESVVETPIEDASIYAQLSMTLPVKAKITDASLVEGRTMVWNIAEGRMNPVTVIFTIPNIVNIAIVIGLLIIIALVLGFVLYGKKKTALTDAELVEDALNHLEGEVDEFVDDPFQAMTDEEIENDFEEAVEDLEDEIEEATEEPSEEE